jgi:hypothetical protein
MSERVVREAQLGPCAHFKARARVSYGLCNGFLRRSSCWSPGSRLGLG